MIPIKDNIPTRRFPVLTVALIVINVIVYLFLQHGGITHGPTDSSVIRYGLIPYEVTHPGKHCEDVSHKLVGDAATNERVDVACQGDQYITDSGAPYTPKPGPQPSTWLTMFTSIFMHGGLLHIAGNMLFLWIFGNNIEDSMSRWRFVIFYLLGGLVANLAQVFVGPGSTAPGIGASGAIAAVLGGYALLYPRARVITAVILIFFITLLDLPALVVLGGWFLLQVLDAALNSPLGGGVAFFAHIGGFVFGLLLIKLFANRVNTDYQQVNRLPVY
ncbi:MAG TPA: rhomboid family intramembrane serine protease [Thermoleophilaceae bacterium]